MEVKRSVEEANVKKCIKTNEKVKLAKEGELSSSAFAANENVCISKMNEFFCLLLLAGARYRLHLIIV